MPAMYEFKCKRCGSKKFYTLGTGSRACGSCLQEETFVSNCLSDASTTAHVHGTATTAPPATAVSINNQGTIWTGYPPRDHQRICVDCNDPIGQSVNGDRCEACFEMLMSGHESKALEPEEQPLRRRCTDCTGPWCVDCAARVLCEKLPEYFKALSDGWKENHSMTTQVGRWGRQLTASEPSTATDEGQGVSMRIPQSAIDIAKAKIAAAQRPNVTGRFLGPAEVHINTLREDIRNGVYLTHHMSEDELRRFRTAWTESELDNQVRLQFPAEWKAAQDERCRGEWDR